MLISIITVNYNDSSGLEKTIKSVCEQKFNGFEHIIIDGGSNDGSKEVILKYQTHFSHWVSETDEGIYHAMNKGIKAAK
ncbi:MAG: glycosyltransferase, partial [Candidatus Paceibacterota bacterium]